MRLPVVGPAWPEEHDALRLMAQVLEVAVRFQGLAARGAPAPLRPQPAAQANILISRPA